MSKNILLFLDFVAQPTGFVAQYIVMKEISSELVATQAAASPYDYYQTQFTLLQSSPVAAKVITAVDELSQETINLKR